MNTSTHGTICGWCRAQMPGARSSQVYCSKRCRQAAWRFGRVARPLDATGALGVAPMRFGYADPPYPGTARRHYGDRPDYAGEVDHRALVARLVAEFPDGWTLSTSAAALPAVLASCPPGARVAAWMRGARAARSYRPLSAWEPVIYVGGRAYIAPVEERRVDALAHAVVARTTDPDRIVGAKPAAFAYWMFDLLGALPGDTMVDLFPGSGGITRAWAVVEQRQRATPLPGLAASSADPRDASPRGEHDGTEAAS